MHDNLFICASCDPMTSTYGFLGWYWDGDRYLQPLFNRITPETTSPIVDFCFVTNSRFFTYYSPSHSNNKIANPCLLLAWCRNGQLCLVGMNSTSQQSWNAHHTRGKMTHLPDSSSSIGVSGISSNLSLAVTRNLGMSMKMNVTENEKIVESETTEDVDDASGKIPSSSFGACESFDLSDENDESTR